MPETVICKFNQGCLDFLSSSHWEGWGCSCQNIYSSDPDSSTHGSSPVGYSCVQFNRRKERAVYHPDDRIFILRSSYCFGMLFTGWEVSFQNLVWLGSQGAPPLRLSFKNLFLHLSGQLVLSKKEEQILPILERNTKRAEKPQSR